ncbi:hypothetical protein [Streptomyces sp. NPDC060198]|uniref:hypothetical protein n=1 Tax=Streptomyces sp. NPDC060198 TaxID=3347070 RepID=UPI00364B9066
MANTDTQTPETGDEETTHPIHAWLWPGEWREALARWIIALLAVAVTASALVLHPWLNLLAAAAGCALYYAAHRRKAGAEPEEEADEEDAPAPTADDMADIVRELGTGTGVLLTGLAAQLLEEYSGHGWTTKHVRALLADAGVRVREGVRVAGVGNGPGVHREDVPPPLSPAPSDPPVDAVGTGQSPNANANNVTVTRSASGAQITITPAGVTVDKV